MSFRRVLFALLCSIVAVLPVCAQNVGGSIAGTILDPSGAGVPNAKVTVTNTDRNAVLYTTASNLTGNYIAPQLPIGHYSITVEASGFKTVVKQGVTLSVNSQLTENVQLEVGAVQQQVNVEASPVQVDLQTSIAGNLIGSAQVNQLSLNSRNYEQLVALMPGVTFTGTSDQIYIGVSNPFGASNQVSFSVNGARTSQNNWTVDGADNVDRGANLTLLNYPSVDSIEEFKVLRSQYSAEFGRNGGGMVNVVTKSGTNDFHGNAYEFFRNNVLAANNFFNNANKVAPLAADGTAKVPPLRYNNFGYTIGGPVWIPKVYKGKDKTFFFFSQEFRRVITYTSVQGVAPTAQEKQGIFPSPVCVQYSGNTCTQTATQITNIDPFAAGYLKDIFSQVPDAPASHNIFLSGRNIYNARQELAKIDHVLNAKWRVSGRYLDDSIPSQEPRGLFQSSALPNVATTNTNSPGRSVVTRLTGSVSPTLVLEAGYTYSYGAIISTPVGLTSYANSPDIRPSLPYPVTLGRVPLLSFTTLSSIVGYGPYNDYNRNHNWFASMTKIHGNHTLKAGFTFNKYNKQENNAAANVGSFSFTTSSTLTPAGTSTIDQSWANFLLGNVTSFTQAARDITPSIHQNQAEMYVQDDYRVRRNLTVNLGVRYSLFRQPTDGFGYLNNFSPAAYDPAKAPQIDANGNLVPGTGDPLNGFIQAGKNSPYDSKVTNERNHNFAPRAGLSWDPFGQGKTAVRAGYGISYDAIQVSNVYENLVFNNPPSIQTITINNTTTRNITGGTVAVSTAPPAVNAVGIPFKTPYMQQWSLDIQQELPHRVIVDIGYFGSKGTNLIGTADINEVYPGFGVAAGLTTANVPFNRTTDPKLNAIRPYRGYNAINSIQSWYDSRYNSLQAALRKEFKGGGFLGVNYTWSKLLTNAGTDVAAPMNTYNRQADYGLSPYDRTHVFTADFDYPLPQLKDKGKALRYTAGGWEVSGVVSASSGLPFNASDSSLGTDPGGLGFLGSSSAGPRADQVCDPNQGAPHTIAQWFNTSCFTDVPIGQVRPGNAGRNTIRGPGFQTWTLSLFKNFAFAEHCRLQIRGESFNAFNHTNWSSIGATLGSSTYGNITAARDPRIVQLGAKLYF